jgi:hypothetical protein
VLATTYGLRVDNLGKNGITNAYGVYIAAQSGAATTNIGLYNGGSETLIGNLNLSGGIKQTTSGGDNNLARTGIGTGANNTDPAYDLRVNGAMYVGGAISLGGNISTTGSISAGGPVNAQYLNLTGGGIIWQNDNSADIGSSGSQRPRDLWLGRNLTVGGNSQLQGTVGVGVAPASSVGLNCAPNNLTGTAQYMAVLGGTFTSATTSYGVCVLTGVNTQAATFTMPTATGFQVNPPSLGAGSSVGSLYGVYIQNQGASGVTSAWGIYVANQSGATKNVGIEIAGMANAAAIQIANNAFISARDSSGNSSPMLSYSTDNWNGIYCGAAGLLFVNNANTTRIGTVDNSGNFRALSFTPTSARKLKADIQPLNDPLGIVLDERVHGVSYTERATGERRVGFVADDWAPVLPEVVAFDNLGEVLALDYDRLSAVTFEALKQYVARTEARLAALENAA